MTGWRAILKRELLSYFVTPIAWLALSAFLLVQGLHFFFVLANFAGQVELNADAGPVQTFFGQTVFLYLPLTLLCPVLTMRLLAEERRSGSVEALLTTPVTPAAVVLGKYLAVLLVYVLMWLPTLVYMWTVSSLGPLDWQVVGSGYLAVIAVGAGYLALGTMTSALSRSQLGAALMSSMLIISLFIIGVGGEFALAEGIMQEVAAHISVWSQMNDFSRGIVDSRRLIFNATLIVLPLFIAVRAVESWRLE